MHGLANYPDSFWGDEQMSEIYQISSCVLSKALLVTCQLREEGSEAHSHSAGTWLPERALQLQGQPSYSQFWIQDTRYFICPVVCTNYTHIGLSIYEIWYMWCIHIKLSNYAILHFLMNIEIRFPIFTSSLDFNNCINLNMLGEG